MPSVVVVEQLASGRTLVQIVGGTHDGEMVVVMGAGGPPALRDLSWYLDGERPPTLPAPPPPPEPAPRRAPTCGAKDRARALLESLLTPQQLAEWQHHRCFWVSTPAGPVRLGRLYQLDFRPRSSGRELLLCVVPAEPRREPMPEEDVWVNLLLMLHDDPWRFFRTANWRFADGGNWHRGPAPVQAAPPASRAGTGGLPESSTRGRSTMGRVG